MIINSKDFRVRPGEQVKLHKWPTRPPRSVGGNWSPSANCWRS